MGMSIDDVKEELISIVTEIEMTGGFIVTSAYKNELKIAIATMRKYQKIVQIMERTVDDGTSMYDTLQEIEEVIEDGNDD